MTRKVILDKASRRIKGYLNLQEKEGIAFAEEVYTPESDEVVIPEDEVNFDLDISQQGDLVAVDGSIDRELKTLWYYYIGNSITVAGKDIVQNRQTLEFDRELTVTEETELETKTGKTILSKNSSEAIRTEIETTGLKAGDVFMPDTKKTFLTNLKKAKAVPI